MLDLYAKRRFINYMKGIFVSLLLLICPLVFAQQDAFDDLPKNPASPVSGDELEGLVSKDDAQSWLEFAKKARGQAMELVAKQLYDEGAGWLYSALAAEMFAADGAAIPKDVKRELLKDLPAFYDFYETIRPEDKIKSASEVLSKLYSADPDNVKKYLRMALATSLVYDEPPPPHWPQTCMPASPEAVKDPVEMFKYFAADVKGGKGTVFPLNKLTVGELIWVVGVPGPISELESIRRPNMAPFELDRMTSGFKTDRNRQDGKKGWTVWPSGRPFTLENMRKYGAIYSEKPFYAWRTANASGVPCLFFGELIDEDDSKYRIPSTWITYMARPGLWKFEVARNGNSKSMYGRPLDPQTWKHVNMYDIEMLHRRHIVTREGIESYMFLRFSEELFFKTGDFRNAAIFADKAKKSNVENWKAYHAFIYARARFGASEQELDGLWRRSYEAFRRYPDQCITLLNIYRKQLEARRNQKESNRLFVAEMRAVMREDPGLAFRIYQGSLKDIFRSLEDKTDIFPIYTDVLRISTGIQKECLDRIVIPLAKLFNEGGDNKGALKVINMYESMVRPKSEKLKDAVKAAKDSYAPRSTKKADRATSSS